MLDNTAPKGYSGYCIDLIDEISNILKFDYVIYTIPDRELTDIDKRGDSDGLIKELVNKRADVALGSIYVTAERETVVDYTIEFYDPVGLSILMKLTRSSSLFKFLTVFSTGVWLTLFVLYIFTR